MHFLRFVFSVFFDFVSASLFVPALNEFDFLLKSFNNLLAFDLFLFFDLLGLFELLIILSLEICVEVHHHLLLFKESISLSLAYNNG